MTQCMLKRTVGVNNDKVAQMMQEKLHLLLKCHSPNRGTTSTTTFFQSTYLNMKNTKLTMESIVLMPLNLLFTLQLNKNCKKHLSLLPIVQ